MRVAALCLLLATPALADDGALREDALVNQYAYVPITTSMLSLRYRLDLVAAGLASSDGNERQAGGVGAASVDVGLSAKPDCDVVRAGGQISGRSEERLLSASQWASICPLGGADSHVELTHRLDWDVTPRLLAAPSMRRGAQRRETAAIDIAGSTAMRDDNDEPTEWSHAGHLRIETVVGWADGDDLADFHFLFDVLIRSFTKSYGDDKPMTIEIARFNLNVLSMIHDPEDHDIAGFEGDLGTVEGLRAGPFRFGARLGGRVGAMFKGRDEMYEVKSIAIPHAGVSVELGPGRIEAKHHSMPVFGAMLVVEDRARASVRGARGKLRGMLDLSIARTQLRSIGEREVAVVGGVTAEASYELTKYLSLRARSEFGRSFYAPGDGTTVMAFDRPQWASETMLMLAAHAQRGPQR